MKRLIFTAIAIFCVSTAFSQQKNFQYHPWKEFQGKTLNNSQMDTLLFLDENFAMQDVKDKNIEWLLKTLDKEMPVKSIRYGIQDNIIALIVFNLNNDIFNVQKPKGGVYFGTSDIPNSITQEEAKVMFGGEPNETIPLTQELRKKIGYLKLGFMISSGLKRR